MPPPQSCSPLQLAASSIFAWLCVFLCGIYLYLQFSNRDVWQTYSEAVILQGLLQVDSLERQVKKQQRLLELSRR